MTTALQTSGLFRYSLPALPLAFAGIPLYVAAPDFYAAEMGLSLGVIATILLCVRVLDAIQDPVIGYVSDKYAAARGAVIAGAFVIFAIGFCVLYIPSSSVAASFAGGMFLATMGFSFLSINLNAVGSLLSRDTRQKTVVTTWREAMGILGLVAAMILPVLLGHFYAPQTVFALYAICFVLLCLVTFAVFMPWLKTLRLTPEDTAQPASVTVAKTWQAVTAPAFRGFFLVYGVSMLASALPAVLVLFFIRDALAAKELTGVFLLVYFVAGLASMPLWRYAAARFGKWEAWAGSMLLAALAFIWAGFLSAGDIWAYGVICLVSGMALGAELSLPPSLLSDLIDKAAKESSTAAFFSVSAFLMKMALALAGAVALGILDVVGFVPAGENSESARLMLSALYAFVPSILKILCAIYVMLHCHGHHEKENSHEKDNNILRSGG